MTFQEFKKLFKNPVDTLLAMKLIGMGYKQIVLPTNTPPEMVDKYQNILNSLKTKLNYHLSTLMVQPEKTLKEPLPLTFPQTPFLPISFVEKDNLINNCLVEMYLMAVGGEVTSHDMEYFWDDLFHITSNKKEIINQLNQISTNASGHSPQLWATVEQIFNENNLENWIGNNLINQITFSPELNKFGVKIFTWSNFTTKTLEQGFNQTIQMINTLVDNLGINPIYIGQNQNSIVLSNKLNNKSSLYNFIDHENSVLIINQFNHFIFAHEWFHYIDQKLYNHYFDKDTNGYLSDNPHPKLLSTPFNSTPFNKNSFLNSNLDPNIYLENTPSTTPNLLHFQQFKKLVNQIKSSLKTTINQKNVQDVKSHFQIATTELKHKLIGMGITFDEQWFETIDSIKNAIDHIKQQNIKEYISSENKEIINLILCMALTQKEIIQDLNSKLENLINPNQHTKKIDKETFLDKIPVTKISLFKKFYTQIENHFENENGIFRTGYFSRNMEIIARSFEYFIFHKQKDNPHTNSLTNIQNFGGAYPITQEENLKNYTLWEKNLNTFRTLVHDIPILVTEQQHNDKNVL